MTGRHHSWAGDERLSGFTYPGDKWAEHELVQTGQEHSTLHPAWGLWLMNLNRSSTESRLGATCSSTVSQCCTIQLVPSISVKLQLSIVPVRIQLVTHRFLLTRRVSATGDVSMLTQNLTRISSRKTTHSLHTHTHTHIHTLTHSSSLVLCCKGIRSSSSPSSPSSPSLLSTPLLVTETLRTDVSFYYEQKKKVYIYVYVYSPPSSIKTESIPLFS